MEGTSKQPRPRAEGQYSRSRCRGERRLRILPQVMQPDVTRTLFQGVCPMSNYTRVLLLICILGFGLAVAQIGVAPKTAVRMTSPVPEEFIRVPVQRVVLYKNGVGYFEHSARVCG